MHMLTIDQLLSRVVERKGYAVQGADGEALFARKGDEALLAAWKTDGPLSIEDANAFLTACEQVHAVAGILLAPSGVDPAAKDALATVKGVEVWAESRIVLEVGEALVRDAWDSTRPAVGHEPRPAAGPAFPPTPAAAPAPTPMQNTHASLVSKGAGSVGTHSGAAYFMPNKPSKTADNNTTIRTARDGSLGYAWGGPGGSSGSGIAQYRGSKPRIQTDQWGNVVQPSAAPAAAQAPAATAPAARAPSKTINADEDAYEIISTPKKPAAAVAQVQAPPACNTLQMRLTKEEALAKVSAKPGAIVKLALVPHVAFEYDVHLERPGMPAPVEGKGAVLVSSITGDLRTIDGLAYAPAEPGEARKDAEKLQAVDVYDKVKGFMLKTYSRTMNVEREVAGTTVMETLKLVPDPDEMGLQHRGVVYVPVWEITGGGVNTKVDAYTGQAG